jgi:ribose 5-phosphate isomerase B
MKIILASDHRGFALKEQIKKYLNTALDVGAATFDPEDDYVDYASKAVKELSGDDKIILFCGSGHGMDIAANRFPNIRAILGFNFDVVKQGREHEDANCLIIPSDWTSFDQAKKHIDIFLNTPFSNEERHLHRLEKLKHIC